MTGRASAGDTRAMAAKRGIVDAATGHEMASKALRAFMREAEPYLKANTDMTLGHMALMALLTRGHAFHEAVMREIKQDNPFSTFALLRSYAENAAVMAWLTSRPMELIRLGPLATERDRFKIGPLVAAATNELPGFRKVYEYLSGYSHPSHLGLLASYAVAPNDESGRFRWQSRPRFRSDEELLQAYLLLVELAEVNGTFWGNLTDAYIAYLPNVPEEDRIATQTDFGVGEPPPFEEDE